MSQHAVTLQQPAATGRTQRFTLHISRHWLAWVNLVWGVFVGLPWLAPVLMRIGAGGPGRFLYFAYSMVCHQLADRSFFLFGARAMYSYRELMPYLSTTRGLASGLRAFIGTPELGYKVAWSDRMAALYGGVWLGGLLFAFLRKRLLRRRLRRPRWWAVAALALPMVVDGGTHFFSDLAGVEQGFRYQNAWLAALTGHVLAPGFYAGTGLGSFNSWMRLLTGLLFGLAVVWLAYPALESVFLDAYRASASELSRESDGGRP